MSDQYNLHPEKLEYDEVLGNAQAWVVVLNLQSMLMIKQSTTNPDGFAVEYNFDGESHEIEMLDTMNQFVDTNDKLPHNTGAGVILLIEALATVSKKHVSHAPLLLAEGMLRDYFTSSASKLTMASLALTEAMKLCGDLDNPFKSSNGGV